MMSIRSSASVLGRSSALALLVAGVTAAGILPGNPTPRTASALAGARLYVDPSSQARHQADALRRSRPAEAAALDRIASRPQAFWFGDWNRDVRRDVSRLADAAARSGAVPVLVAYNIPQRDCGGLSGGGGASASGYRRWVRDFAAGLAGRRAVVVLEPDALALTECLSAARRDERFALLREAVRAFKGAGATVYLDAGHARWVSAEEMAGRLRAAGVAESDGFALNVSNYLSTGANIQYGERLSRLVGGKHFVVDTGRNGAGSDRAGTWCNARGQSLGTAPTTQTRHPLVDAFLWIKRPGESDGACNGGPRAGQFWNDHALELARR